MFRAFGLNMTRLLGTLALAFLLVCVGLAQEQTSPDSEQESPSGERKADQKTSESNPGTKITPQQAEELFRDVDTILNFASKDTSLPIKHEVKRRLASREEVVSYLKKNMAEDKDVQR